ncbi:MAG: Hpt domain-containing protein [Rhizobiaceae bacterium]
MALKQDVAMACKAAGMDKPVDLVHLARQTMGDRDLEKEVLGLFLSHCEAYLDEFKNAPDDLYRKQAAHRIKGAARSLGAWELAELAELAEAPDYSDFKSMETAAHRVSAYIRDLTA